MRARLVRCGVGGAHQVVNPLDAVPLACTRRGRFRIFPHTNGSTKLAVPTCTAVAPASMNSSTSRASMIPPMPMMGIDTAWRHSYTMRTAIGRMAGPLSPPMPFDRIGLRVSTSMAIARNVLTSEMASAPASSAARAKLGRAVTFGVSFGISGRCVAFRTALTTP